MNVRLQVQTIFTIESLKYISRIKIFLNICILYFYSLSYFILLLGWPLTSWTGPCPHMMLCLAIFDRPNPPHKWSSTFLRLFCISYDCHPTLKFELHILPPHAYLNHRWYRREGQKIRNFFSADSWKSWCWSIMINL